VDNIDGSFLEERQSGILYNYKNAENEHGTLFHYDIYKHIMKILNGTNTEVINSKGTLEIKSAGIKMYKLVDLFLEKISSNSLIDFVFYLGNDSSDEKVYEFLKS